MLLVAFVFVMGYATVLLSTLNQIVHEPHTPAQSTNVRSVPEKPVPRRTEVQSTQSSNNEEEVLLLHFENEDLGSLHITLRPDLHSESRDYVRQIMDKGCKRCSFYRAEKPGILQGIIKHPDVDVPKNKGTCPAGNEDVHNDCPDWDKQCACHGPVMHRGMVAWAAGATGPDFFIDAYPRPAKWWGTQHTVWGELDEESLKIVDKIWDLPVKHEGLTYLVDPLKFTMELAVR